jgi:hypothetical protein
VRIPFSKDPKKVGMLPVNQAELRKVMVSWTDAHDLDAAHPDTLVQTNKMILALASEAANDPAAQNAEGAEWILFIVDEDGWVLNQEEEYLVRGRYSERQCSRADTHGGRRAGDGRTACGLNTASTARKPPLCMERSALLNWRCFSRKAAQPAGPDKLVAARR